MKTKNNGVLLYFARNIFTVIGLVLVWRGIWYILDGIDKITSGEGHLFSAVAGTIIGLAILYFPDKDLKEIEKL